MELAAGLLAYGEPTGLYKHAHYVAGGSSRESKVHINQQPKIHKTARHMHSSGLKIVAAPRVRFVTMHAC
jgi:hypothetical protein